MNELGDTVLYIMIMYVFEIEFVFRKLFLQYSHLLEVIHGVVRLVFDNINHSEGAVEQVSQFGQWFKMLGLSECFYISGQNDLVQPFKLSIFRHDE